MTDKSQTRRVFITGGTGTVGESLVEAFTKAGADVSFQFCRNVRKAMQIADKFNATSYQLDFEKIVDLPRQDFDILINNAGINENDEAALEIPLPDWDRTIRANLYAPFLLARQCLPWMVRQKWGRIVNISSIYGLYGVEGRVAYVSSKHGLWGLTKTIAREYAPSGVTCNEICPGPIRSAMMNRIARKAAAIDGSTQQAYIRDVAAEIPAGRLLLPAELAELAIFLASEKASYINGVSIPIDGAMTA